MIKFALIKRIGSNVGSVEILSDVELDKKKYDVRLYDCLPLNKWLIESGQITPNFIKMKDEKGQDKIVPFSRWEEIANDLFIDSNGNLSLKQSLSPQDRLKLDIHLEANKIFF